MKNGLTWSHSKRFIIRVSFLLLLPSDPRLVFVWDIGLTMAALVPVQNADWNYLGDNGFVC